MKTMADYARAESAAARKFWDGSNAPTKPPAGRKPDTEKQARYRLCAQRGMTQAEAAEFLGVTRTAVSHAARRWGITFVDGSNRGMKCQNE